MKKIDIYILKDLIKPFIAGVSAFVLIMISNNLFLYTSMIMKSGIPLNIVIALFLYMLPAIIVITFPVAYLFAVLLILGRLSKDSEINALRSCGVGFIRIIFPILIMSLIISFFGFIINEKIVPHTNHQSVLIMKDMISNQKIPSIKERLFTKMGNEERFFYTDKVNIEKERIEGIFVLDSTKEGYPKVISADYGIRNKNKWILYNGSLKKYSTEGFVSYEIKFKEMELEINIDNATIFSNRKSVQEMSSGEAIKQLDEYKKKGINTNSMEIDYYLKFSLPLATFFIALISAPIGIKFAKMGSYFGVAISIVLVFIWYLIFSISRSLGITGTLEPIWAAWLQNIIFGFSGITLMFFINRK